MTPFLLTLDNFVQQNMPCIRLSYIDLASLLHREVCVCVCVSMHGYMCVCVS